MDGFFSRFAYTWLDRQPSDFTAIPPLPAAMIPITPAKKTWSKHAGHRRTLSPHQVSSSGYEEEVGPPAGP